MTAAPRMVAASIDPVMTVSGRNGTRWVIDRTAEGGADRGGKTALLDRRILAAHRRSPERTATAGRSPPPRPKTESICSRKTASCRNVVRGLSLARDRKPTKANSRGFGLESRFREKDRRAQGLLDRGRQTGRHQSRRNGCARETSKVKLQPNPLLTMRRVTVELAVGFDADGSFLKTSDGLPLCSISETPELVRGLLASSWLKRDRCFPGRRRGGRAIPGDRRGSNDEF